MSNPSKHISLDQFLEESKGDYLHNEEYKKEYLRIFERVTKQIISTGKPVKFDTFVSKEIPNFLYQSQEDPKNKAILDAFFDVILKKPNRYIADQTLSDQVRHNVSIVNVILRNADNVCADKETNGRYNVSRHKVSK